MNPEKSRRPGRTLSRNERELWASFTRVIAPLRAKPAPAPLDEPPQRAPVGSDPSASGARPQTREKPVPPVTSLDRRLRQRLNRGRADIDCRIDLHGLTQAQAHDALVGFLRTARAEGARIVLVITGKGRRGGDFERGVLRRQIPFWLRSPQLRDAVLGFETAGPAHGGDGAFYVLLRRARS